MALDLLFHAGPCKQVFNPSIRCREPGMTSDSTVMQRPHYLLLKLGIVAQPNTTLEAHDALADSELSSIHWRDCQLSN